MFLSFGSSIRGELTRGIAVQFFVDCKLSRSEGSSSLPSQAQ